MVEKEKYDKMINYAYRKFKEAQKKSREASNSMEYWFVKALKLEEYSQSD